MRSFSLLLGVAASALALTALTWFVAPDAFLLLRTQTFEPGLQSVTQEFAWTPDTNVPPGNYPLTVTVTDDDGATTSQSTMVMVQPAAGQPSPSPSDAAAAGGDAPTPTPQEQPHSQSSSGEESSGGGSGGGDDGGQPQGETQAPTGRKITTPIGLTAKITGAFSGVVQSGAQKVARLAHNKAVLSQTIPTASGNCWLDLTVKGDRGPDPAQTVKFVVRLNNRAWRVLQLPKGHTDNKYRTYRIGLLRNFNPQTTLSYQLLNDAYNKEVLRTTGSLPEDQDLNLFIQKSMLVCER